MQTSELYQPKRLLHWKNNSLAPVMDVHVVAVVVAAAPRSFPQLECGVAQAATVYHGARAINMTGRDILSETCGASVGAIECNSMTGCDMNDIPLLLVRSNGKYTVKPSKISI